MNKKPQFEMEKNESGVITVLLADDHPIIRDALRNFLAKEADIKVIAEASDGEEAVKLAIEKHPDIIIMDIGMPVLNGLDATRIIKLKCPSASILVLTVYDDSENILGILEAGAAGYLTKSIFGPDLVQAIRSIAAGESVLAPAVLQQILGHVSRYEVITPLPKGNNLTNQELMVLKFAAKGLSNKEIGQNLQISPLTVKGYLIEIFSKLGVSSRTEAVVKGLQAGYLNLRELG